MKTHSKLAALEIKHERRDYRSAREASVESDVHDKRLMRLIAQMEAHNLGLLTLTPEQEARFEKEYWNKRLLMEHDLAKQFEPILKQRQMQLSEDLYREFSPPNGPLTQNLPKPPAPAKPVSPQANGAPSPPTPTRPAQAGTNSSQPPTH